MSKRLMEAIEKGDAPFAYIPTEIGELKFCCTDNERKQPYSKEEKRKKLTCWICGCLIIPILFWAIFNNSPIIDAIVSIICVIVLYKALIRITHFKGTDYFVGSDGFAVVSFEGNRDNIISKTIHTYDEFSEFITGETIKKVNGSDRGTDYFFGFFSVPISIENNSAKVKLILDEGGTHQQEKNNDDPLSEHYTFWKNIEREWTARKLKEMLSSSVADSATFSLLHAQEGSNDWYATPYVTITSNAIFVGGREYNRETLKRLWFENGNLVIEHINHSKKLLGLIEKGDIEHIPLTNIGNKKLFILYLQSIIKL